MTAQEVKRGAGILLAISSLPSPFGIGTLGDAAFRFVDLLVDLKQKYWQVLPVEPTEPGDRAQPLLSAFAGNPYLIDLERLVQERLLAPEEIDVCVREEEAEYEYAALLRSWRLVMQKAYERFDESDPEYVKFLACNREWLEDYSLFMALKEQQKDRAWQLWPEEIKNKQPVALAKYRKALYNKTRFWGFCQYKFFEQWSQLKRYANAKGIQIIGDLPFYVGEDSADVWAHKELFLLDGEGYPVRVTASEPSYGTGQVFGHPLYDWQAMEAEGFAWWKRRMEHSASMYDLIRIDHAGGFVKSYTVLRGRDGTAGGRWQKGPGRKLVEALNDAANGRCVIADEGGGRLMLPGMKKLLDKSGWFRMRSLMLAFDGDTANAHLPHNYTDCHEAVYAGTCEEGTIARYFREKTEYELAYLYEYLHIGRQEEIADAMIRCAYASVADLVVIQMQDILKLGCETRTAVPWDSGWRWHMGREQLNERRRAWIRNLAAVYRR